MIRFILASFLCVAEVAFAAGPAPRPAPKFVVHMSKGEETPAQYKGKVVILALILTSCPHCQNTTIMLSRLQKEYGPKGLQVLGAAFNEDSANLVSSFVSQYSPSFPIGYSTRKEVLAFVGGPENREMYVPILAFIDRQGLLRNEYFGNDPFFADQEKNIRTIVEQLLKTPSGAPATKKAGTVVITPTKR